MNTVSNPTVMAHDDTGGDGHLVVLLPGAGDLRSEHRFLAAELVGRGFRVVSADLPGHGDSQPAPEYTVASTATAIIDLVESLQAGPALVAACSFAPAAAVWAAVERPELFSGIVAISPHLHGDDSLSGRLQGMLLNTLVRGPWAAAMWARFYTGWYKTNPPADLDHEVDRLRAMFSDPVRRAAARRTLTASRNGMDARIERLEVPTLTVFGSMDDHFDEPVAMAERTAGELGGAQLVVEGAGHYPHVEQPQIVASAVEAFFHGLS